MRAWILASRRNAHQSGDIELQRIAAKLDELHCIIRRNASLLWLETGIDLNIELEIPALLGDFHSKRARNLLAINRLDDIKERDSLGSLVGLQRPYQMQFHTIKLLTQAGPLALRFLDPVFPENALPSLQCRTNFICIECLGDGNQ